MRKHYANIKDTLYSDTIAICKAIGVEIRPLKSPFEIQLTNWSKIIFKGLDNAEKSKGLSDVDIILMDEANEFTGNDFETIDQSIRGKHQENSIYLCHNPVPKAPGEMHWFEKLFRVNDTPGVPVFYHDDTLGSDVATMKSTYKQNLACPEHVKRRLEGYKTTNPALYKLWALGEYAEIQGAVFKNYDVVDSVPDGLDEPGYGLDFGYSNDPAACCRIWHNSSDIYIKGLIYSTGLTNSELYTTMTGCGIGEYDNIVADSAEPKSIRDLYDRGFKRISGVKKRLGYKEDMANVLQAYKIHLLSGDTSLLREFQTYSWATDKDGRQLPKLQDGNDHYIDAVLMYCSERLRQRKEVSFHRR